MKKEFKEYASILAFLAAAGLCVYGAVTGEADAVLLKAAKICMECIGLG